MSKLETLNQELCPVCKGNLITDHDNQEIVCTKCGITRKMEESNMSSKQRSILKTEKGLATIIPFGNKDINGKPIPVDFNRLRYLNNVSVNDNKTRSERKAIKEIEKIAGYCQFKEVVAERVFLTYKKVSREGLVKGRSVTGIISASFYYICNEMQIPFPMEKIVNATGLKKNRIAMYSRLLFRNFEKTVFIMKPEQYLSNVVSKAELPGNVERYALEILRKIDGHSLTFGKKPITFTCAAVYYSCVKLGQPATKDRIARAGSINGFTIQKRYDDILNILGEKKPIKKL